MRIETLAAALFAGGIFFAPIARPAELTDISYPVMGESRLVFDSNPAYINDHSIIQAADGSWHMIGITHDKVVGGRLPVPTLEEEFAHARAPELAGPWTELPRVLPADLRRLETHVWAPHLVHHDGLYYCFYAGGGGHWWSMINLATSPDLMNWTRAPENPLFRDFYDARDPMVLQDGGRFIMYYTKTYSATKWWSTVACRLSTDLIHWSEPDFAIVLKTLPIKIPNSGQTESPFVLFYNGLYYLFICTPDLGYQAAIVYVSDDPLHFEEKNEIATLPAHCAEVVSDHDRYFLSHAGWFFDGLYLAPLEFRPAPSFSPALLFADSGDTDDYLYCAPGSRVVTRGLYKALKAGEGEAIEYRFPVPEGVSRIGLAFEESGECLVTAGGRPVLDEGDAGPGEPRVRALEIENAEARAGELSVRFEDSSPDPGDGPVVSYVKIYFR